VETINFEFNKNFLVLKAYLIYYKTIDFYMLDSTKSFSKFISDFDQIDVWKY